MKVVTVLCINHRGKSVKGPTYTVCEFFVPSGHLANAVSGSHDYASAVRICENRRRYCECDGYDSGVVRDCDNKRVM